LTPLTKSPWWNWRGLTLTDMRSRWPSAARLAASRQASCSTQWPIEFGLQALQQRGGIVLAAGKAEQPAGRCRRWQLPARLAGGRTGRRGCSRARLERRVRADVTLPDAAGRRSSASCLRTPSQADGCFGCAPALAAGSL
jgi:hypothetical protein